MSSGKIKQRAKSFSGIAPNVTQHPSGRMEAKYPSGGTHLKRSISMVPDYTLLERQPSIEEEQFQQIQLLYGAIHTWKMRCAHERQVNVERLRLLRQKEQVVLAQRMQLHKLSISRESVLKEKQALEKWFKKALTQHTNKKEELEVEIAKQREEIKTLEEQLQTQIMTVTDLRAQLTEQSKSILNLRVKLQQNVDANSNHNNRVKAQYKQLQDQNDNLVREVNFLKGKLKERDIEKGVLEDEVKHADQSADNYKILLDMSIQHQNRLLNAQGEKSQNKRSSLNGGRYDSPHSLNGGRYDQHNLNAVFYVPLERSPPSSRLWSESSLTTSSSPRSPPVLETRSLDALDSLEPGHADIIRMLVAYADRKGHRHNSTESAYADDQSQQSQSDRSSAVGLDIMDFQSISTSSFQTARLETRSLGSLESLDRILEGHCHSSSKENLNEHNTLKLSRSVELLPAMSPSGPELTSSPPKSPLIRKGSLDFDLLSPQRRKRFDLFRGRHHSQHTNNVNAVSKEGKKKRRTTDLTDLLKRTFGSHASHSDKHPELEKRSSIKQQEVDRRKSNKPEVDRRKSTKQTEVEKRTSNKQAEVDKKNSNKQLEVEKRDPPKQVELEKRNSNEPQEVDKRNNNKHSELEKRNSDKQPAIVTTTNFKAFKLKRSSLKH